MGGGATNYMFLVLAAVWAFAAPGVSNASASSTLPYFRAKALAEEALSSSGLSYAIVRPTLVFAREDVLVNNIAWLLRRLPLVAGLAGYAQLGERPPGAAPRCRHGSSDLSQGHQGDVILMLPALPNEGV